MELYRNGLKLTATIGLDESRGSVNVPVRLLHNEKDEYLNYTEQIHIRYLFDNQVKEEILPTNDNGFYIPGKPLSHNGPIELAVHLINGNVELVTNELSFIVNNAPNGTTQVDPSEFTWQQLVDQYVNAKLDTFADKADMNKFKDDVNANLSNQDKKITDLQNTTKVSLDSQNTKIDNFKSEVNTSLSNQNTSINQTTSAQNSKITTLEGRMDTFTRLSEGSTTGDAELQDIRVGANGTTYDTAGNAVRGQYSQLKEDLGDKNNLNTDTKSNLVGALNEVNNRFILPVEESVKNWLNEHPEATTTVQDHSLNIDKMIVGTLGYVTPEMFGAIGDGVTDDTIALQNFMNSDAKIKIFDENKIYIISDTIFIQQSNLIILGKSSTIKINTNRIALVIPSWESGKDLYNIKICDLNFEGSRSIVESNTQPLIRLSTGGGYKLHDIIIRNCNFSKCHGYGIGIYNDNTDYDADLYAYNIVIDGCNIKDAELGICQSHVSSMIINCSIYNTVAENITVDNGCKKCKILNSKIGKHGFCGGIGLDEATDVIISNNIIDGIGSDCTDTDRNGITFNARTGICNNIIITNNIIRNHDYSGITFGSTQSIFDFSTGNCEISNNTFANNNFDIRLVKADDKAKVVVMDNIYSGNTLYHNMTAQYLLNHFKMDSGIYFYIANDQSDYVNVRDIQIVGRGNYIHLNAKFISKSATISEGWKDIYRLPFKTNQDIILQLPIYEENGVIAGLKDFSISKNGIINAYWVGNESIKQFYIDVDISI